MSFVDPSKSRPLAEQEPGTGGFLGVAIVSAPDFITAVNMSWRLGINPGGQVSAHDVPEGTFFAKDMNRLLTREEAESVEPMNLPPEDCRHTGFTGEGRCIEPAVEGSLHCKDHQDCDRLDDNQDHHDWDYSKHGPGLGICKRCGTLSTAWEE